MPSLFLYSKLLGVHSFVDLCSGTTHLLHEALPGYFSALLRLFLLLPPLPPALCHFSPQPDLSRHPWGLASPLEHPRFE